VGPLFYYELVRLARQGRSTFLRCAYAAALLVALYFAYRARIPGHDLWASPFAAPAVPVAEFASLAQGFVLVILRVQAVAVFVLTPVYLAGAIAEERERGTLELLFTTHLSDREIVLGKLAARVTHLGGILLAGLPLLAATQLWGGVNLGLVVAAFAMTGLNLLSVGALSVLISVLTGRAWPATTESCAASAVFFLLSLMFPGATPAGLFTMMNDLGEELWTVNGFPFVLFGAALHAAIALACGAKAVSALRSVAPPHEGYRPPNEPRESARGEREPVDLPRRRIDPLPINDHPLLWRETSRGGWSEFAREFEYGFRKDWPLALGLLAFIFGTLGAISYLPGWEWRIDVVASVMRGAVVCAATAWCVGTAFRATGSVGRERETGTLDGLLTMPCGREAVLGAKWLGAVLRGRDLGYGLALLWVLGLVNGSLHPAALALLALSVAAQLAFWASLGLWLSVACRTTLRARVTMTLLLLAFAGSFLYLSDVAEPDRYRYDERPVDFLSVALNPLRTWSFLAFGWRTPPVTDYVDVQVFGVSLAEAALGTLMFALASGLLWLGACRRFRKEGAA
jgi:ABC-type transport system involved in multi-copper enzyme maturation permease subunit